jgi:hypothetical protein
MEVRLRSGGAGWTCSVSLKLNDQVPAKLQGKHPFAETQQRDEVEDILKYAQWTVLNAGIENQPLRTYRQLLRANPRVDLNQTAESFSRNIILVEILGAEIRGNPVNVTFLDLPGIIVAQDLVHTP